MNKLLVGLLGAAGVFLLIALVLYLSAPKPDRPAAEKSASEDKLSEVPEAPLRPKYETPEALVADYKNAMSHVSSTETVNAALTDYALCQAFRAGSPDRCVEIDGLNPTHMRFEKCLPRYHKGMMLKELLGGSGEVESCVWVMKYRFEGESADGDHDETPMIRKNCLEAIPYWTKGGDYEGLCRTEAGILALDDDPPQEVAARCKRSNRSYFGDPAKCEGGFSGFHAYCPEHARLVKALRSKDAGPVQGAPQEPLANPRADCRSLAVKVMGEYEGMSKLYVNLQTEAIKIRRFEEKEKQREEKEKNLQELETREQAKKREEAEGAARLAEIKRKEEDARRVLEAAEAAKRETAEKYERARLADEQKRLKQGKPLKKTKELPRETQSPPPPSGKSGG